MSNNKIVYFFPHAGGSASCYKQYYELLKKYSRVVCCEYKGHGSRYSEKLCNSVTEEAENFLKEHCSELESNDFIFFGHSYGTLVIYEVCILLNAKGLKLPKNIFLSSCVLPTDNYSRKKDCSFEGIRKMISDDNLTDERIINSDEVFSFFYPIIANDINNLNNYKPKLEYFDIDSKFFSGSEEYDLKGFEIWEKVFHILEYKVFSGNHGYVMDSNNIESIVSQIKEVLN